ncbi:hypothetical protein NCCP1664_06820 [Zafaria cholistanensis]|uniref:Secreted protein n=1 Tax=Zafaria cholistanensis TaxID=1682741 RepID=A0A5A7NMQ3_9MICC|nr:hypothetical protein [Zafaria cholistanensis]GER22185.1 hypothetical protein NCCP1664_06820 [Zafaria cholistanensis]
MFNRILWVGIGVGIGALAARKIIRVRDAASAEGLNRTVARLADGFHDVAGAFREGMASRETELRSALGIADADATPGTRRR